MSSQDLQQVMVSGPNLNETSIVSGGYGGTTEGIIPTSSIKGRLILLPLLVFWFLGFLVFKLRCGAPPLLRNAVGSSGQ